MIYPLTMAQKSPAGYGRAWCYSASFLRGRPLGLRGAGAGGVQIHGLARSLS